MFETINKHRMLDNVTYKRSKDLVQLYIPGLSSFYFIIGNIFGFPSIEAVIGFLAIITTLIGMGITISSWQYGKSEAGYDGNVIIETTQNGGKLFSLELGGDPEELEEKTSVAFKVKPKT